MVSFYYEIERKKRILYYGYFKLEIVLLHIKEKTFSKQSDLASHLGYHIRTMELWLKVYKYQGIKAMLIVSKPRKAKKHKISKEVHVGLSVK